MVEQDYWKHKSKLLQFQLEEIQITSLLDDAIRRRMDYCRENNIPTQHIRFDDTQFTIEEIKQNGGQTTGRNT